MSKALKAIIMIVWPFILIPIFVPEFYQVAFPIYILVSFIIFVGYSISDSFFTKVEHSVFIDEKGGGDCYAVIAKSSSEGWVCVPYDENRGKPGKMIFDQERFQIKKLTDVEIHVVDARGAIDFKNKAIHGKDKPNDK